jgi:hypothetical protein
VLLLLNRQPRKQAITGFSACSGLEGISPAGVAQCGRGAEGALDPIGIAYEKKQPLIPIDSPGHVSFI